MRERLRRWLWAQESTADDFVGGALAGIVIVVVFHFGFGDSWLVSLLAGAFAVLISAGYSRRTRARRLARGD